MYALGEVYRDFSDNKWITYHTADPNVHTVAAALKYVYNSAPMWMCLIIIVIFRSRV